MSGSRGWRSCRAPVHTHTCLGRAAPPPPALLGGCPGRLKDNQTRASFAPVTPRSRGLPAAAAASSRLRSPWVCSMAWEPALPLVCWCWTVGAWSIPACAPFGHEAPQSWLCAAVGLQGSRGAQTGSFSCLQGETARR